MQYEIVFESERINFIKFTDKLVYEYIDMINDEDIQKCISHEKFTLDLEKELKWIKDKLDNNEIGFSMIDKETNEFIGNIEIMNINNNKGELGITITPKMQNKHYGYEAINRIIEYAFNELNLNELNLNVYNFNERAIHLYEKVGFAKDGEGKTKEDIHMKLSK